MYFLSIRAEFKDWDQPVIFVLIDDDQFVAGISLTVDRSNQSQEFLGSVFGGYY
jgi:hypothetical protein